MDDLYGDHEAPYPDYDGPGWVVGEPEREPAPEPPAKATGAQGYPYDPALRVEMQVGLDKLRCVQDRAQAEQLFQLYRYLEPKWLDGTAARWLAEERKEQQAGQLEWLRSLSSRALAGGLGDPAKQLALHMLEVDKGYRRDVRDDLRSLQEFESELRKLRVIR